MRVPIEKLKVVSRRYGGRDLNDMIESIKSFGQMVPILIDEEYRILDGVLIFEALRIMGYTEVECTFV